MLEKALNYVLKALFRDTAIAHLCCHLAESTWGIPEKSFQNAVQECLNQIQSEIMTEA